MHHKINNNNKNNSLLPLQLFILNKSKIEMRSLSLDTKEINWFPPPSKYNMINKLRK